MHAGMMQTCEKVDFDQNETAASSVSWVWSTSKLASKQMTTAAGTAFLLLWPTGHLHLHANHDRHLMGMSTFCTMRSKV